jgi:hypothetical protein
MVFDKLLKIFLESQAAAPQAPEPTTPPVTSKPLAVPHPEEPVNPSATLANTDLNAVMTQWLSEWGVPAAYWNH